MSESEASSDWDERRFCHRCGRSVVPLTNTLHAERECDRCGDTIYVAEPGDKGKGIKIRKGDRVKVPPGLIKLSLDPKIGGSFFRLGLFSFVDMLLTAGRPKAPDELEELFERYENEALDFLQESPLLEGLEIDQDDDSDEIWERLSQQKESRELAAALTVSFVEECRTAIAGNETRRAAWALYNAGIFHSMFVAKETNFQTILWEGYKAHQFLSKVDDAAAQPPAEVEALEKLKPLFSRLDEATLHTWIDDGRPIGPRINVPELPNETLRATGRYYLSLFDRHRKADEVKREEKRKNLELVIKFVSGFGGLGAGIIAALKAFGVI